MTLLTRERLRELRIMDLTRSEFAELLRGYEAYLEAVEVIGLYASVPEWREVDSEVYLFDDDDGNPVRIMQKRRVRAVAHGPQRASAWLARHVRPSDEGEK